MKKILSLFVLGLALAAMSSCGNREVVNIVKEFAQASNAKDAAKMEQIYPDSKLFTVKSLSPDDIDVSVEDIEGKADMFKATVNDNIVLFVKKSGETYQIESSHGLLDSSKDLAFAKKTGQYKESLTDVENSKRLNDKNFLKWILEDVVSTLGQKVKVVSSTHSIISRNVTEWFDSEPMSERYTSKISITVTNELDTELSANAYSVISSVYTYTYESSACSSTTNVETRNIPAHGSTTLTYTFSGEGDNIEGMGWISRVQSVLSLNIENLDAASLYVPKGGEYDEYLKNHASSGNDSARLNFVMHGIIGGDSNASFNMNGDTGGYTFVGASRQTKLVSYDSHSGKLVIDAYLNGARIGYFDGSYSNGTYKGIFTNTNNGARLDFKLSE